MFSSLPGNKAFCRVKAQSNSESAVEGPRQQDQALFGIGELRAVFLHENFVTWQQFADVAGSCSDLESATSLGHLPLNGGDPNSRKPAVAVACPVGPDFLRWRPLSRIKIRKTAPNRAVESIIRGVVQDLHDNSERSATRLSGFRRQRAIRRTLDRSRKRVSHAAFVLRCRKRFALGADRAARTKCQSGKRP